MGVKIDYGNIVFCPSFSSKNYAYVDWWSTCRGKEGEVLEVKATKICWMYMLKKSLWDVLLKM